MARKRKLSPVQSVRAKELFQQMHVSVDEGDNFSPVMNRIRSFWDRKRRAKRVLTVRTQWLPLSLPPGDR